VDGINIIAIIRSNTMNFEQLIRYTLEYGNQLRYYHWQTPSYAQHEALGEFYNKLSELTDGLVESWQGRRGNITVDQGSVELVDYTDVETVIESAESLREVYEAFKETIGYGDIQNQIDEIVELINHTIYVLRLK
jgi:hypothetical protein